MLPPPSQEGITVILRWNNSENWANDNIGKPNRMFQCRSRTLKSRVLNYSLMTSSRMSYIHNAGYLPMENMPLLIHSIVFIETTTMIDHCFMRSWNNFILWQAPLCKSSWHRYVENPRNLHLKPNLIFMHSESDFARIYLHLFSTVF